MKQISGQQKNFMKFSIINTILIIAGVTVVGFIVYVIYLFYALNSFDGKNYTPEELVKSFNEKRKEIYEVKSYFNHIVPKYKVVAIEFTNDDEIGRLDIVPKDTGRGSDVTVQFEDWNLKIKSHKVDSLLKVLGWTNNTLSVLKKKLDNANCISIDNGEPAKIGFKRSGMGMYFFNVFDKPMPDGLKARYNDSCMYIYVNSKLVLEYGGGAIGNQCFFNKSK